MIELNELQAIEMCLGQGVLNANRKLESYKRRGYLDNKASVNSLMTDLLTIYESCELKKNEAGKVLGGKKRIYIVGDLRPVAIPKEDKRVNNGYSVNPHTPIMAQQVLKYFEGNPQKFLETAGDTNQYVITNSRLAKEAGLLDVESLSSTLVLEVIGENIEGIKFDYPQNIVFDIQSFIRDRNRNSMNSCLSYLNREKFIHRSFRYMMFDERGGSEISNELYETLSVQQRMLVGDYNSLSNTKFTIQSIGRIRAKAEPYRQKHEKEFFQYMEKHFASTLTKANVVQLIKPSEAVSKQEFLKAYVDSLLTNALRDFNDDFKASLKEASNEKKFFNFILICVLEKLKYPMPNWTKEYTKGFQRFMGFGKPKVQIILESPIGGDLKKLENFFE